jgi:hypothetical protein
VIDVAYNVPSALRWMTLIYAIIAYFGLFLIDESVIIDLPQKLEEKRSIEIELKNSRRTSMDDQIK